MFIHGAVLGGNPGGGTGSDQGRGAAATGTGSGTGAGTGAAGGTGTGTGAGTSGGLQKISFLGLRFVHINCLFGLLLRNSQLRNARFEGGHKTASEQHGRCKADIIRLLWLNYFT